MGAGALERGGVNETERLRRWQLERWISLVRLIALPWAAVEVAFVSDYPSRGYEAAALVTTGFPRRWARSPSSGSAAAGSRCAFNPRSAWPGWSSTRRDLGVRVRLHVRVRDARSAAPLLPGRGSGAALRAAAAACCCPLPRYRCSSRPSGGEATGSPARTSGRITSRCRSGSSSRWAQSSAGS